MNEDDITRFFEVAKATEVPVEGLTKAEAANVVLMETFRDACDDPTSSEIIKSMTL